MIDRFEKFTDEELHELRFCLEKACRYIVTRPIDNIERLLAEVEHVQVQREHRVHREALPA